MNAIKMIMSWLEGLAEPDWQMYHSDGGVQFIAKETLTLLEEQEEQIKNRDESLEKAREEIKWLRGMLKEQEPVKPKINEYGEAFCECGENVGIIPNSKQLPSVHMKFCPECGKPILWESR